MRYAVAAMLLTLLTGCAGASPASSRAGGGVVTGKAVTFTGATSPGGRATALFANLVKEKTHGSVVLTPYLTGELGSQLSVLEQLETGAVQFADGTTVTDSIVPEVDAFSLPYLLPNYAVATKVVNSPTAYEHVWNKFLQHGVRVLGVTLGGYGDILSVKPITDVSSFVGLRWRTPSPVIGDLEAGSLRANPTPLDISEVFTALSTHVVDAVSDPPATFVSQKWYEQAHYVGIINDIQYVTPWLVNEKFWESLSPSEQSAIQEAVNEAVTFNREAAEQLNNAAIDTMRKAGLTINQPSLPDLARATQPMYDQIAPKVGGKEVVDALVAAVRAAAADNP
ncbi:MAG: TRAP transporter substrate-binding protein [Pseudonocardia sp.]|nr:TRAP transporter substrate-binding protein [Pseudonocardia sp.]